MSDDQPDARRVLESLRRIEHYVSRIDSSNPYVRDAQGRARADIDLVRGFVTYRTVEISGVVGITAVITTAIVHDMHQAEGICVHTPFRQQCRDEAAWFLAQVKSEEGERS